ncbi:MAG: glutaredoxin family protein [Thermodesulfovibrionales bacterium]
MPPAVKLYALSTCSHCKAAKKLLGDCAIQFSFTDVDLLTGKEREAIIEEVRRFNPECSFPTIIIGDTVIVGFKESEIRKALGLTE